ncbi:MAG TPA: glycosyltransferase, partial [Lysobacter sp.]
MASRPASTRPLTVVQLLPALESGGVERSTLEIAQALVDAGHRAIVVSRGGRLVPRLQALGATHVELDIGRKSLGVLRHVLALRRVIVEAGADIVHARSRLPAWVGLLALRGIDAARRPRFVTTVHGLNSPSRYSAVMTRGERVICVSRSVRDYVLRHYPSTDPSKLRVIPRGIDATMFPRAASPDADARAWAATQYPAL